MKAHVSLFYSFLHMGGAQRALLDLAEAFAQRGLKVDIVLVRAEGPFVSQLPTNVRVIELAGQRNLTPTLLTLSRYLIKERPDALLSFRLNPIAAIAKRLARVPTKVVLGIQTHLSRHSKFSKMPNYRLLPLLARLFYRWADCVVAASSGVKEDLIKVARLPPDFIRVIHNPVVTPRLLRKAQEPIEHPWFKNGEPPVILGVGRLNRQKDFPTLIKAFSKVRARRHCRLMILGEGEERQHLEALINKLGLWGDVSLPGYIENPYPYMAHADLFVLSSSFEGFPYVLVEAMACGTPVVSTDCPSGPSEILDGGRYGRLVPVGDVEALSKAILASLDNPIDKRLLQERARDFSIDPIAEEYLKILLG